MLEQFWRVYVDVKIAEEYYLLYTYDSKRFMTFINAGCMIVSFTGVIAWANEHLAPLLSGVLILAAQIISVLQPFYPFSERLYAARCIHNDLKDISLSAEQTLNQVLYGPMGENQLPSITEKIQTSLSDIERRYALPDLFPRNPGLHRKAEQNAAQYLKTHFNLEGWNE